ncbi:MAG: hypothetical protein RQ875_02540 [Vicingaceae bacterium]|nr:hypothetical protein [Vicingaceae bacterium]
MKKIVSLLSLIGMVGIGFAQENLVPNHDFQQIEKKVKEEGQINMATPWVSPTLAPADLYTKDTKNGNVGAPENAYGEEKPMSGDNYAGFMAYSYKNKEPRSYLQVQLKEKLEAGKKYCVTMNVSLADLSKYATSHIGMAITKNAISANNTDILKVEKQIISKKLKIYEQQYYWVPVCGVFTAEGDEEFLTIGNFTPDETLKLEKVKRPRGFSKPQLYDAYYYVDNVSVVETTTPRECDCDTDPAMKNVETVNRNFSSENDPSSNKVKIIGTHGDEVNASSSTNTSEKLENSDNFSIEFMAKSYAIDDNTKKIDKLIAYLKVNPAVKIKLIGHIDISEKDIDKLDGKRVAAVYKYILSKGIKAERVQRDLKSFDEPLDEKNPLKNMRVEVLEIE